MENLQFGSTLLFINLRLVPWFLFLRFFIFVATTVIPVRAMDLNGGTLFNTVAALNTNSLLKKRLQIISLHI